MLGSPLDPEFVADELQGQPDVQGGLMTVMGRVFLGLGLLERAKPLIFDGLEARRKIYPPEHIGIGDSLVVICRYESKIS